MSTMNQIRKASLPVTVSKNLPTPAEPTPKPTASSDTVQKAETEVEPKVEAANLAFQEAFLLIFGYFQEASALSFKENQGCFQWKTTIFVATRSDHWMAEIEVSCSVVGEGRRVIELIDHVLKQVLADRQSFSRRALLTWSMTRSMTRECRSGPWPDLFILFVMFERPLIC
ncbi:hypothetical protein ACFX2A_022688 [Malus domestica]